MTKRNSSIAKLSPSYLFPEINRKKMEFLYDHPNAKIISLGIGDTTEPISPHIDQALISSATKLGTPEGYTGYGPDQGLEELRYAIAEKIYHHRVSPHDIFISDGAKCDIGRLQLLFGNNIHSLFQDPAYPVYVDASIMNGVQKLSFLPCTSDNNFWPSLSITENPDLIYWCSPNNPTGAVSTKEQLKELVAFAHDTGAIIIFDSAYSAYIQQDHLPRSIFEIEGAEKVACEIGSFSKIAGFSGVRLGWTVFPDALKFKDGHPVKSDWKRVMTTIFNGASIISQHGGIAALSKDGLYEIRHTVDFYMENTRLLKDALLHREYKVFGGDNAPYLWVKFSGKSSWEAFQEVLEKAHLITTPGSGFGAAGEGYLRFSGFGHRHNIEEAAKRIITSL